MKDLLDLPYDILLNILHHFISNSTVEELIRLETVCKQMRQLCLSQRCLLDALEMLETRPPFKSSRVSLLDLCAADLRKEIVRAVKLGRSWMAEGGPSGKETMLVQTAEPGQDQRYNDILPLPEVDLILASHTNGIHCWSTSQRKLVWGYTKDEEHQNVESPLITAVTRIACDVADDSSFILIAMLYERDRQPTRELYIQVHQLDTTTLNGSLLFESPYMYGVNIYYDTVYIRDAYVAVKTFDRSKDGIIIMDWRERSYYRIQCPKLSIALEVTFTRDNMFLAYPEGPSSYRLASIRYRNVSRASSSSSYSDWPVHKLVDLQTPDIYSHTLLPCEVPPKYLRAGRFGCLIAAEVSTWSRHPTTRITVTLVEMRSPSSSGPWVAIFDSKFMRDADGRDTFVLMHEYKTQERMAFLTTPSAALRAIIRDASAWTGWTSTFAVAFSEYDEGAHLERMNRFQLPEDSEGAAMYSTLRMDPRGRMLVYQIPSAKCISVIRFDE